MPSSSIDIRGTWYSEGIAHYLAPEEAQDFYDAIEWAGTRPWSNGKVGLTGVSYLAQMQWRVAELNPPHLAAINPWEGWTDTYRETATHGGIPDTHFWPTLWNRWGAARGQIEDLEAETREHPLYDDFWRSKAADFSKITTPAFVVASWTDQGLHTRGTFEGFKHIASKQKYLLAHGQKKWAHYYVPENKRRLRDFFDHVLKGVDNDVKNWPKVQIEVRERNGVASVRAENEWPIARTQYTKLYLDAANGRLEPAPVAQPASVSYGAAVAGLAEAERATFEITFDRATELTGYMKLRVFMSCTEGDDMDVFVGLHKLDAAGAVVPFAYYAQFDDGPVALGRLRASHRELDLKKSTEWQPVHTHAHPENRARRDRSARRRNLAVGNEFQIRRNAAFDRSRYRYQPLSERQSAGLFPPRSQRQSGSAHHPLRRRASIQPIGAGGLNGGYRPSPVDGRHGRCEFRNSCFRGPSLELSRDALP